MINDEPQNNSSQQAESVELIPLAPLLENPDPDFDVVVEKRSRHILGRREPAAVESRPASQNSDSKQA